MSAPSPGAGLSEGLHNGPASNLFARQLAKRDNVEKLTGFMLDDYSFEIELIEKGKKETKASEQVGKIVYGLINSPFAIPLKSYLHGYNQVEYE